MCCTSVSVCPNLSCVLWQYVLQVVVCFGTVSALQLKVVVVSLYVWTLVVPCGNASESQLFLLVVQLCVSTSAVCRFCVSAEWQFAWILAVCDDSVSWVVAVCLNLSCVFWGFVSQPQLCVMALLVFTSAVNYGSMCLNLSSLWCQCVWTSAVFVPVGLNLSRVLWHCFLNLSWVLWLFMSQSKQCILWQSVA